MSPATTNSERPGTSSGNGARGGPRQTVSACIIAFNEEASIAACLDSVSWCDEIVVIDSFSDDRTVEIAREHGARVEQRPWAGHVAQKNIALDETSCDWVLSVDCDERVTPALRDAIIAALEGPPAVDGFFISRKLFYLGRWLEHGGWFPEWRLRLVRRGAARWTGVDPHDTLRTDGPTARIEPRGRGEDAAVILHYSFRDLGHQLGVLDRYTEIQAGELFRTGRRAGIADIVLRPLSRFLVTWVVRGGFLDGMAGLQMAVNHAYAAYMKYARLWELQEGLADPRRKEDVVPGVAAGPAEPAAGGGPSAVAAGDATAGSAPAAGGGD